jgi:hypothetical protein
MGVQPEIDNYDGTVYSYETTDPVIGGIGGVANAPLLNLANRTKWLKAQVTAILGAGYTTMAAVAAYCVANFQPLLGFTPVQQGTGIGQLSNAVKIGWSSAGHLKATVDTTDLGFLIVASDLSVFNGLSAANGYEIRANGMIDQWGIAVLPTGPSSTAVAVTFPIPFTTLLNIQTTPANTANSSAYGPSTQAMLSTTSGFTIRGDTLNSADGFTNVVPVFWRALGR